LRPRLVLVCDRSLTDGDGRMRRSARLYSEIASVYDVLALTRVTPGDRPGDIELGANFTERRIARTSAETEWQAVTFARNGADGGDDAIFFDHVLALNPAFDVALREAVESASAVISVRPYAYRAARSVYSGPMIYDALSIEYTARVRATPFAPNRVELLERVPKIEHECAHGCDAIVTGSAIDAALITGLYGLNAARVLTLAAAFDRHTTPIVAAADRAARKAQTSLRDRAVALFAGSATPANVNDVAALYTLASHVSEVYFLVIGRVAEIMPGIARPANVAFTGAIDDATFATLMAAADMFVVPGGSRPSPRAKLLDAVGHGVPLVLSDAAAAGLFTDGIDAEIAPVAGLPERVRALLAARDRGERYARAALATAASKCPMSSAAAPIIARINELRAQEVRS